MLDRAVKFVERNNPVRYFKVIPYHKEFIGFDRPCNIWELTHRMGSEKISEDFEKIKIDSKFITYVPLLFFGQVREGGMIVTPAMAKNYPWYELASSIKKEGFRIPLVVECGTYIVIEGKHRIGAVSLIKPYNPDRLIPTILIKEDAVYSKMMFGRRHPYPLHGKGRGGLKVVEGK